MGTVCAPGGRLALALAIRSLSTISGELAISVVLVAVRMQNAIGNSSREIGTPVRADKSAGYRDHQRGQRLAGNHRAEQAGDGIDHHAQARLLAARHAHHELCGKSRARRRDRAPRP